jgi:uncharacterized membrane protein YkoI
MRKVQKWIMEKRTGLYACTLAVSIIILLGVFVGLTFGLSPVIAQVNSTAALPTYESANMTEKSRQLNISGLIPLQSTVSQALRSKIQVSMAEAITTVQNTTRENSSVVAAYLSPLQGFLVYNIGVIDANNTLFKLIVDPGNGEILYTSEGRQLDSFHHLMPGLHGHGKEFGHERGFGHSGGGQFGDWKRHGGDYGKDEGGLLHNR